MEQSIDYQPDDEKSRVSEKQDHQNFVYVSVITTSGSWPSVGFAQMPRNQPVKVFLDKATAGLKIVSTPEWVARVGVDGRIIDPAKSYADNQLSGQFSIDYGPDHGGGGA